LAARTNLLNSMNPVKSLNQVRTKFA